MTCTECGEELHVGVWPWCPHQDTRFVNAKHWDDIVVWQSDTDAEKYSFPGMAEEPVPAGYHKIVISNLREGDQFVSRYNEIERRRMDEIRAQREQLDDQGIKERREAVRRRISGNAKAEAMFRAARDWADRRREQKRASLNRDPHFHIQVLSYDSGNRKSYSGPETGWRERKS